MDWWSSLSHQMQSTLFQPESENNDFVGESRRIRNATRISSVSGKISKRKSRASKKSPTTYITADPANFRQMVQQVTGGGECGFPVEQETHVRKDGFGLGMVLPTLDTSSTLLLQETFSFPTVSTTTTTTTMGSGGGHVSTAPIGFDTFSGFPTLESWGAM